MARLGAYADCDVLIVDEGDPELNADHLLGVGAYFVGQDCTRDFSDIAALAADAMEGYLNKEVDEHDEPI